MAQHWQGNTALPEVQEEEQGSGRETESRASRGLDRRGIERAAAAGWDACDRTERIYNIPSQRRLQIWESVQGQPVVIQLRCGRQGQCHSQSRKWGQKGVG